MSTTETATKAAGTGFPFLGILTAVFVIAKILHLISWPWWLVFLPLYGPAALILAALAVIMIVAGIGALIIAALEAGERPRRRAIRRPF